MTLTKINLIATMFMWVALATFSNPAHAQVHINEFLAYNASAGYDSTTNNYSDWIEIYNPGSASINISGYYLTDNLDDTVKWKVPPGTYIGSEGFLLIWADGSGTGLHTNFKLSSDGEEIGLFKPDKTLVDSVVYIPQQTDISFGRKPDGSDQWFYFDHPTPESANTTEGYLTYAKAGPPVFSIQGGFYSGNAQLLISSAEPSAVIRYTLNGNEPSNSSPVYSGPITMNASAVVRAKVYAAGMISSETITHTYFIDVDKELPVFSLVCDSAYLWDTVMGIYHNSAIDQERLANIEYFEGEQTILNQSIGIQIHGFVARYLPQKIFGLYAGNKYGKSTFDHKFFPDKDIHSFSSIFLRNGGFPENSASLFRDGMMQRLVSGKVDLDYQAYRPAVLYVNGEYWGLYNIREKQNAKYLAANNNIDPSNIDYLENHWMEVIEGDKIHFSYFMDFITNNDISNPENYAHVKDLIDVDNLLDYMITEMYYANTDWPGANQKYWRSREENGKWQWILTDVEFGFGMEANYDHNTLEFALATDGTTWANPPEATFMFRKLLENNEFKNEFIQRFAAHLSITFKSDKVLQQIENFRSAILAEMPYEIERWKDEVWMSSWGQTYHVISNMGLWEQEVEIMRQFAIHRASHVRQHIVNKYTLDGQFQMTSSSVGGHIKVNGVKAPEGQNIGVYFNNIPLHLEAIPRPGLNFQYWLLNSTIVYDAVLEINQSGNLNLSAVFGPGDQNFIPEIIDFDLTLSQEGSPYVATGDIMVHPGRTLSIGKGVDILMPDSCCIYVFGSLTVNGTEEYPCSIKPNQQTKSTRWGALCIQNATGEVTLNHLNIQDASFGRDKLAHKAGITSINSDVSLDGVRITGTDFPFYSEFGNISILNSFISSDKTCDMINVKYASSAIVENCTIKGNQYPDTDGIDYDQIANGIIRNNIISGFAGFNSDGIDIGEAASEILIENNRIYNCSDKGISVGQASSAIIKRNFIYNCNLGIGIKDSLSYALIDQNTFYNNNYAVACFEKNWGAGGGNADIKNSILSECLISPVFKDDLSTLEVTYSLSDTEPLTGMGNILDNPKFEDPLIMNFELKDNSPCIDAGDPGSPQDPDGSQADMGAYFIFQPAPALPIVINEINYASHPEFNSGDWVEIYNNSGENADLSGWVFKDGKDDHTYRLPENFILEENAFLVLCDSIAGFTTQYPDIWNYRGPIDFGLKRKEETLRLFDAQMNLADLVEYTNEDPWPTLADGLGYTLQLLNPSLDNNDPQNWQASSELLGNPGSENFGTGISEKDILQGLTLFPNPSSGIISFSMEIRSNEPVRVEVIDLLGRRVYSAEFIVSNSGGQMIDLSHIPKGMYLLSVNHGRNAGIRKLIIQ